MDVFPKILISSSRLVPHAKTGSSKLTDPQLKLPALKPGQIIKAIVLDSQSSRQTRLQILGKTLVAKTDVPLNKGETILLEVSKAGQQPVFKLIWNEGGGLNLGSSGAGQNAYAMLTRSGLNNVVIDLLAELNAALDMRSSAANPSPHVIQKLLSMLETSLQQISLKSGSADKEMLPRLIRYGGLTLENKLGHAVLHGKNTFQALAGESLKMDVKAIALKIAEALSPRGDDAGQSALKFVEFLETLQLMNHYASETSGRYLIPIPVFFDDLFRFGQILIDMDRKHGSTKNKEDRLVRVSFLLELSRIGDFLAEVLVYKTTVSGSVTVGSREIKQLVDRNIPGLIHRLKENGFDVQHLECRVTSPEKLAGTSLVDNMIERSEGLLNLIV